MDDLIKTLENFIEKKIAAERDDINDGYVSRYTQNHLDISRKELRITTTVRRYGRRGND